jgi:hypothetical protein
MLYFYNITQGLKLQKCYVTLPNFCVRDKLDAYISFEVLICNMCILFISLLLGLVFATIHLHFILCI